MGTARPFHRGIFNHPASIHGYSLVELIVAVAIFGIVARIAIPHFDARRVRVNAAQQLVLSNLRLARAKAITKSVHYRVDFTSATQMQVSQMKQDPVTLLWSIDDTKVQTLSLPSNTRFASGSQCVTPCQAIIGTNVEFNSRGLVVNLAAGEQITLVDDFGVYKALQTWPSGQVNAL